MVSPSAKATARGVVLAELADLCRVLPPSTLGVLPQSADSTAGARKIIFMHVLGLACNAAVRISIDPAACQSFGKGQLVCMAWDNYSSFDVSLCILLVII